MKLYTIKNTRCYSTCNILDKKIKYNNYNSSQYTSNLGAVSSRQDICCNNIIKTSNQSSDRIHSSNSDVIIPTRGNSSKRSITRLRPGTLSPGGNGVDTKHSSYNRYLAKKKAKNLLGKQSQK